MNDKKKLAQFILLMAITFLMIYICWLMIKPLVSVLLWSSILVIIFFPLYKKLLVKIKNHTVSAIITILASLLIFIIPLTLISAAVVNELAGIAATTVSGIQEMINHPERGQLKYIYDYVSQYVNIEEFVRSDELKSIASRLSETALQASWYVLGGVAGTLVSIFFAIFTMFYLFRDGEKIVGDLPNILPLENDQAKELIKGTSDLISATIRGSLMVALIQGILAGVMFWILGIPSYLVLGMLTMIFALIPTGGTAFVTGPVIIILALTGEYWKAGILLAYASLVIGMVDNFLLPRLIKQKAKMNELFVFFSVIGGIQLFGILGLFLGPIILAIAIGLLTVFKGGKINKEQITVQ
ncbi:MAG TPA: AI-2E family transporter [Ignavibacteria bacterium]|nr:AI-2E family transporter [Ignavibacteria bacterium]HRF67179.1 AI-2E family transporter [Ignavibacteria bacterium]HRJ03166.1 AI-2E family transporter [Ignavibacteria bacterium]